MGLSIVISGAIIFVALMFTLMNIPNVFDSILSVEEVSSEISELEDSISQTEMSIDSIESLSGNSKVNFTLINEGNEKLWNYDKFDLFITYDADIGGVKTKLTEQLINGISSVAVPIGLDRVTPFNGNCDPCNFPHVMGGGSDQIIIVGVSTKDGGTTADGVTYDSLPLTKIRSDVNPDNDAESSLWYRTSPSTGSNTVSVDLSTTESVVISAISFNNVDSTIPIDDDNGNTGTDDTPTVDVFTTVNGALVVDNVNTLDGPMTEGANQVLRWDLSEGSTIGSGSTEVTTTDGSYTMDWTNGAGSKEWAISAAALRPALPGGDIGNNRWSVNSITPDILDPGLINNNERAEIVTNLSHPIFPSGTVIILISSDNGVITSLSEVT